MTTSIAVNAPSPPGIAGGDRIAAGLRGRYAEPHRRYHTLQHLEECFAVFEELKSEAADPLACELALWFHDAVYDTSVSDNEPRSAALAKAALIATGVDAERISRVEHLILATKSHQAGDDFDAKVVLDCDLAILGAAPDRFAEYENQIRAEYGWVPEFLYRKKRREILAGFLARPRLYLTARGVERFEAAARENLRRALDRP